MRVEIRDLKVGDEVAVGHFLTSWGSGRNLPSFKVAKVKKINKASVSLENGTVINFNGNVKGEPNHYTIDVDRYRQEFAEYKLESDKRKKLDKIEEMVQTIRRRGFRVDALSISDLEAIESVLKPVSEMV